MVKNWCELSASKASVSECRLETKCAATIAGFDAMVARRVAFSSGTNANVALERVVHEAAALLLEEIQRFRSAKQASLEADPKATEAGSKKT